MTGTPAPLPGRYAVRAPRVADAAVLGRIHVQIWREAYAGLGVPPACGGMPQDHLDALDIGRKVEQWRAALSHPAHAGVRRLVGTCDGDVVGFVVVGPGRDEERPTPTELQVLNVLAAHHGTGLADQLITEALGNDPAYLWVLEGNTRAQRFYSRYGLATDGARKAHQPTGAVELRMVRG